MYRGDAHLMGVGDGNGRAQETGFLNPVRAGEIAVAVQDMKAGEGMVKPDGFFARENDGYARPRHTRFIVNEGAVSDAHARHIGDGVVRASG